jgi:hypothetical protein
VTGSTENPRLAATARQEHDSNRNRGYQRSGWRPVRHVWLLIPLISARRHDSDVYTTFSGGIMPVFGLS